MPDRTIHISFVTPQGQPIGGAVDIDLSPQAAPGVLEPPITLRNVDASKAVDVPLPPLGVAGQLQLAVRSRSGAFEPIKQLITLRSQADDRFQVVVQRIAMPPRTVKGTLVFDNGLPASGVTARAYYVGFADKPVQLASAVSDASGAYLISYQPPASPINLQIKVVDSAGAEVTVSATKFNASASETLNLVVPASVRPLSSEFTRLTNDISKSIGNLGNLRQAQENGDRQDLAVLSRSTNWDARLVAFAALAVQQADSSGVAPEVLYALYRVGLPSSPALLAAVPTPTVQAALEKAVAAGIVQLSDQQRTAAITAVQNFASKTLLATTAPGSVSSFHDLLAPVLKEATQQAAFANLFFSDVWNNGDLWNKATTLGIPAASIDALRLQGKFLYLTSNNAALSGALQQKIGSSANLGRLADQDFHKAETWLATLTGLAGAKGDAALDALVPDNYTGTTPSQRATAYAADLARKVRMSFPTQVTARMVETKELAVDSATASAVAKFLRQAAPLGYGLGRTPLNRFLKASANEVTALDPAATAQVKTLHRLYQITPSNESMQAAAALGFTSAFDIAKYPEKEFLARYEPAFPRGEAPLVYRQARTISSVTFNAFAAAKLMESAPPIYASSGSANDRQSAKDALVQQFPTMASLFGNLDFCQCEECRSVLSPAAYFVDVLDLLGQHSAPNAASYTPLDVLIGKEKDPAMPGRRPDLGALPLTCENTNTVLPYIDIVNEILEYYIAHSTLDAGVAYDTGAAATDDLIAEPQHILASVYSTTLKQAVYPMTLPFDLWLEMVRGFLDYFKIPLSTLLDTFRGANTIELFAGPSATPYSRAQILAEALGISPAEYAVFTGTDGTNWRALYGGYASDAAAIADLRQAKTLCARLGIGYQDLVDLVQTGFLNPGLYPLIFQFKRFGISMADAFSFTKQPGFPPLSTSQATAFTEKLDAITATYKQQNPAASFDAQTWLKALLPANYSRTVLVLADPDSGCNFSGTALQYADGSLVKALDLLQLNLFVRLWKKLGWTLDEVDRAMQAFFPSNLPAFADPTFGVAFGAAWKRALVYLAHLDDLYSRLEPALGRTALLPFWGNLPTRGANPLYAQLFLTAGVLNNDFAFDDPTGSFPWLNGELPDTLRPLTAHAAAIQGALGLTAAEVDAILADAKLTSPIPFSTSFSLANLTTCYCYSLLAQCLEIPIADLIALRAMSGLKPFQTVSGAALTKLSEDVLLNQTLAFVECVTAVESSGFTVEDAQYLLRHVFDPIGKYQSDPNALMGLVQSVATALANIRTQTAVPADLTSQAESLIDQKLSSLVPAPILRTLLGHLTNALTYTASQGGLPGPIDPAPFAQEAGLTLQYDEVTSTQSVSYKGLLTDWKKAELVAINSTQPFVDLLDGVQKQAHDALAASINDILGVWASLVQYEAVEMPVESGAAISDPPEQLSVDAALAFTYDQSDKLQWLGYRGVLTDQKLAVLTGLNGSPVLAALLADVQQQAMPAYKELVGTTLAMWTTAQLYSASVSPVDAANQVDPVAFAAAVAAAQQAGTLVDPVPTLVFEYDAESQTQNLTCQGVLTDELREKLAALTSSVGGALLQAVRTQAVQQFQMLAANLVTIAAADLDSYAKPFLGVDAARRQRTVKAALVRVFSPLLGSKLSRQSVLQTLSGTLASDPSLTEALVTDAALLTDPTDPGRSLLGAFFAIGNPGVTATYYSTADLTGPSVAMGTSATADTADPSNSGSAARSCRFEGYLQAPTDGPYRFVAELGDVGAKVTFRLDSLDPASLFTSPVIDQTAAASGDEASQFLQLKGGVAYHFIAEFANVGGAGVRLLVQGETLPRGPLSQLRLYPQSAVAGLARAQVLLSKTLQILQVTAIGQRELAYLVANASRFGNLRLSALPTQSSDDSVTKAPVLFTQFLALLDYADLRKGPAGGTDGLIDVFQAATSNGMPVPAATILANLTRRSPTTVQDVAAALGSEPHFEDTVGVRRIWDALQQVQILGLPVSAISAAKAIVDAAPTSPDRIAANFKNAVKAQYTTEQWRPIAKSVFDTLRRRKRDALVSYLINALSLQSANELFEYFLVDPGMEPVVQTSRLRLAMSSLQTFVQRCLLNLENGNTAQPARNIAPSAIRADWWDWMKRYRVWEANREIFLFPENWMEPELRLDKTDLFQALESDLLQGDVTRDLVEDSFLTYLKGLDLRARLDIIATYFEQDVEHPDRSTLHVLGRTYGTPRKYFYRTFSGGSWSGWEAVTLDIEGDHIALAVWRGRLNVFWTTFVIKTRPRDSSSNSSVVSTLDFGTLTDDIKTLTPQKLVQVQLHWSEHLQGKWTPRISSNVEKSELIAVHDDFDVRDVHIHISTEVSQGIEGAVRIHLDFPPSYEDEYQIALASAMHVRVVGRLGNGAAVGLIDLSKVPRANHAFRVTSKNCEPDFSSIYWLAPQPSPYNTDGVDATVYTGSKTLSAHFQSRIHANGESSPEDEAILDSTGNFEILSCGNTVVPPFLDATDPQLWEAGGLVAPFFFKDAANRTALPGSRDERTFYVQPTLTEAVVQEWESWALPPARSSAHLDPSFLDGIEVVAQVPRNPIPIDPGDPVYAVNSVRNAVDWVTDPATAITYGGTPIGRSGGIAPSAGAAGISTSPRDTALTPTLSIVGGEGLDVRRLQTIQTSLRQGLAAVSVRSVNGQIR